MNPSVLTEAAVRLCDELLTCAQPRGEGLVWSTVELLEEGHRMSPRPGLYDGVAGLCLLFGRAHAVTGLERYGTAARRAARWLLDEVEREGEPWTGFFSGWTGVLYAVLEVGRQCEDHELLSRATSLSRRLARGVARARGADLMEGTAGALLGTLLVLDAAPSPELTMTVGRIAHRLIEDVGGARGGGLFWRPEAAQIAPLAGLAHGASGVAWALALHSAHGAGEGSAWLYQQALTYEDSLPRSNEGDWFDLRRDLRSSTDLEAAVARLREGDLDWFLRGSVTRGWCHGAGGIGLVRLQLGLATGQRRWLDEARLAAHLLRRCRRVEASEWTLCHGLAGDVELFAELARHEVLPEAAGWCEEALVQLVEGARQGLSLPSGYHLDRPVSCPSLFMGAAGVAYTLLRCAQPERVPSVVLPGAPLLPARPAVDPWSRRRVRGLVLAQPMPRSSGALVAPDGPVPEADDAVLDEPHGDLWNLWIEHVADRPRSPGKRVQRLARWEAQQSQLDSQIRSRALLATREVLRRRLLQSRKEQSLAIHSRTPLFAEPDCRRFEASALRAAGEAIPERVAEVALLPGRPASQALRLGPVEVALLDGCSPRGTPAEVVARLAMDLEPGTDLARLEASVLARAEALLSAGLLWPSLPLPSALTVIENEPGLSPTKKEVER